jgi:hypothetical protein
VPRNTGASEALLSAFHRRMKRSLRIKEMSMAQQLFSHDSYSTRPTDLIDEDLDEDNGLDEMDERQLRQARHRRSLDIEDVLECVWAHFRERPEVYAFVEDAIGMPYDPDRIRVHAGDAARLASAFAADVQAALDDVTGMLEMTQEGGVR